jgi:neutral ceramidase
MQNNLQAGVAKVDITPPLGTLINGDFITHYAKLVHDNLFAKALVLKKGDDTIAICVVDICAMRRDLLDDVKQQVYAQTGIKPQNVLISSTHTHASGSVESLLLGAADLPYRQKLPALITQAIVNAQQKLVNAKIGFGSVDAPEYVLCRRYTMKEGYEARNPVTGGLDEVKTNPFGGEDEIIGPIAQMDTQLCYIAIKSEQDEWLSLLANYSMHYVGDWESGTISPDYFGEFTNQLKDKLNAGNEFVGMLSNGTSGEANIWDFLNADRFPKENFAKSQLIGGALAEKVAQSIPQIQWQNEADVAAQYADVTVGLRKPNKEELDAAKELVAQSNYEQLEGIDYATMQKLYAREQVLLNEFPDEVQFPVQALKVGNIVIGALGGEFFAETGLSLKQQAKKYHYFTITLANDYVGYVCPEHEIARGGYETWRCRTSCFGLTAEQEIRDRLASLVQAF